MVNTFELDFAYLQESSTIDMHFRFIISKMCLDIEHDLKVKILRDIELNPSCDGYDISRTFSNAQSVHYWKTRGRQYLPIYQ